MAEYTAGELDELRKQAEAARAELLKRVDGKSNWDVADAFLLDALVELRLALDSPSMKIRFAAADKLATVCSRMPPRPAAPPAKGMTVDDYQAALEAAEQDAAVRAYLVKKGWTAPKEKGSSN